MKNSDLLKNLYEAFGKGDMPTVLGAMHAQINWREAEGHPYQPGGDAWVGPNEVLNKLFVRLGEEWDGFAVRAKAYHESDDHTVTVEGRYTGTYKGTGKELDSPFCHVWHVQDGKVDHFQQYTNTAAFQEVMGVASVV